MAVVSKNQTEQSPNPDLGFAEGRVEDSPAGKTCHQCRQRRVDIVGSCVTKKRDKTCPIKYCAKCLLNRYGEKADDVVLMNDWTCHKCRGNCNCSLCMKKRGQNPTGILVHTAKATGFSSVSELLKTNGSEKYFYKKKVKPEGIVATPLELGQENAIESNNAINKKSKKSKREELKEGVVATTQQCGQENPIKPKKSKKSKREELKDFVAVASKQEPGQENPIAPNHAIIKKSKKSKCEELKDINNGGSNENDAVTKSSPKRIKTSASVCDTEDSKKVLAEGKTKKAAGTDIKENNIVGKIAKTKPAQEKKEEYKFVEPKLPQGSSSINISGIDLPPEDAGNVFQFLEFCSAFGKALDLRKGQAECVVRELLAGRSSKRRQQYSTLTQIIIQLLTVILEDRGETSVCLSATDGSWFTVVGECLSKSEVELDGFPPEIFEKGIAGYEKLDSSKRLKLLSFLCDETLGTSVLRDCIDNLESVEKRKEAKEKLNAAKEKEKQLKQKLQDELAKAVKEKNGSPLSITEHDAIVSRINEESKEAQSEMQVATDMLSKMDKGRDDAIRTKPVELDDNGLVFWKLKSYNEEQDILLQDLGSWGEVCPHEKWLTFSTEQKPELEKYISYIRTKRIQPKKAANTVVYF